ncbi:MAG TPA: M1 family aminopeptidase [Chitinophagaceae bacterium]|nr:M1 family aminopeptidase [Chitinophagaceae bacterium]
MRKGFLILLLLGSKAFAQNENELCKAVDEIAINERNVLLRTLSLNRSLASSNFQVTYYRCVWEIDPSVRYIRGSVTSHFIVNSTSNSISFDLATQLIVDSVYFHNNKISFTRPTDILQMSFPVNISAGQKDSVTIFYKGIPANTGFGSFNQATHNGTPVLWTLSEPYGSKDWWPCRNGLDNKADSIDIIISCPNLYRASSNGLLVNESDNGVTRTAFYKHRYPVASYLVALAVTNYKVLNHSVQLGDVSLPMITYCYPEDEIAFQANTSKVLQALSIFHQYFTAYPFINERYGHTQFSWGGGMEHQTNSFITSPNEGLMAHELAHQWFGDKITCGSWQDIWLNEGFATYLSYFYFEKTDPVNHLGRLRTLNNAITNFPDGSVWVNDTANVGRIFNSRLSYNKGAYLLHMLRWVLGDTLFFRGLRQYITDPKLVYGFARTDDLKRNLEKASGKNLSEFFNDWFTGQGHPSYTIKWKQDDLNRAIFAISQTTSHPSVDYFEMPLALRFKNNIQEKTIIVNNRRNNELFREEVGFKADSVIIDPGYWVLSRNNITVKDPTLVIPGMEIKVYPVPASTNTVTVSINNAVAKTMLFRIFNTEGQLVAKQQINTPSLSELVQINISKLSAGVYLLRIDADDFKTTRHFIKK